MDKKFHISEEESEYYKWRSKAQRSGFLRKLSLAYYTANAKELYTIEVDGNQRLIPVFVDGDWFTRADPDDPLMSYNDEKISSYDDEYLRDVAKSVAYESGKTDGYIDDYIWNNLTYGISHTDTDSLQFDIQLTDYYTVRSHSARLVEEAFQSAYKHNMDPYSSYPEIAENLTDFDLPYRDAYYRNFNQMTKFSNGPQLASRSTIVVMNTGDGYAIPFEKRGADVSEAPYWWNPIPGSVFQPLQESYTTPSMRDDTVHAVADKLTPDHDNRRVRSYLFEKLNSNDIDLEYTTTGIDCINGYYQFYNLLFLRQPEFYNRFISGYYESPWSSRNISLIHIDNKSRLKELLDPDTLNPYNILGLSEALIRLQESYDVTLPIQLIRSY